MTNMEQPSNEQLKAEYLRGYDHGANGNESEYCGEYEGDGMMEAAYEVGWEDGADLTSNEQLRRPLSDRIDSRFRAMHGVYE